MHTPVLLQDVIDQLAPVKGGRYIDATFGEGGYTMELINRGGRVLAIDWDKEQGQKFKVQSSKFKLVWGNFADIEKIAKDAGFFPVNGIVFDLGLSMGQIADSGRGFSYRRLEDPLDMRLDESLEETAADLIKKANSEALYRILAGNSEELRSKEIATAIKNSRKMIKVADLIAAIDKAVGFKSKAIYARIFQALRIEVNHEFENLVRGLGGGIRLLEKEGRLVVVTFHSREDRIVKNFVRKNNLRFLEKKPIKGREGFSRSAKLRTIIK